MSLLGHGHPCPRFLHGCTIIFMSISRMRNLFLVGCIGILILSLSACQNASASANSELPTSSTIIPADTLPIPASTQTMPIPTATTAYSTEVIILPQPTLESIPQWTVSLPGNKIPQALIQIVSPGPGSQMSQSFTTRVSVYPGDQGNVAIHLYGEDGRVIVDAHENVKTPASGWVSLAEQIDFVTQAAGENGLLVVSTCDGYGRLISLTSVQLLLLQIGPNEVKLAGFNGDPFVVNQPAVGGTVKGGMLHIEGAAHPVSSQPLTVDLIDTDNRVLATGQVSLPALPVGLAYVPFALDFPYSVGSRTLVRLTLHQAADSPSGVDAALSSLLIFLDP